MTETELCAVAKQLEKIARAVAAGDYHDVVYPGFDQRANRVVNHRLIIDWKQMLVMYSGEMAQPRAQPACENYPFHSMTSLR
jgi:hypothetical protein